MVDGELRFKGIPFIDDKLVPVDMVAGTGDIWLLYRQDLAAHLAD